MYTDILPSGRWVGRLAVAGTLTLGSFGAIAHAQSTPPETVPVVGCYGSAGPLDMDVEAADDEQQNGEDDNAPTIVGSINAPGGAGESDKRLSSLATVTPSQARGAALAALGDAASQRRVRSVGLEVEQGFVVYAVKTVSTVASVDPKLEVKVDAGNGRVLLVTCDPNDD